ncbi:MAG: hypothetical protein JHC28_00700 [Thermoprotei archaeon]|jgi:hypothetical protein|nr:hypothetical protein [Thermoprotei archaeon]
MYMFMALGSLGAIILLYALISRHCPRSLLSMFFGSLIIGLGIAIQLDPRAGLAVVLIYSGGLTALTYTSMILLCPSELCLKKVGARAELSIGVKILAIPIAVSLLSASVAIRYLPSYGNCLSAPFFTINTEDIVALSVALLIAIGAIIAILGGARK